MHRRRGSWHALLLLAGVTACVTIGAVPSPHAVARSANRPTLTPAPSVAATSQVAITPAPAHAATNPPTITPAPSVAAASRETIAPVDATGGAAATARRERVPARSLVVAATGDILPEQLVLVAGARAAGPGQRYDFDPLFAEVAPIIRSADLAICHVETPIGAPGERPGVYGPSPYGGNLLLTPYEMAAAIATAGFDRCDTASNHSNDLGTHGIDTTIGALDEAGIAHTGTATSAATAAAAAATVFSVNGVRIAHLAYTRYSNTAPTAQPWQLNFAGSVDQVAADVRTARAAGAELVIVSVHIFQELLPAPITEDRSFLTALTAAVTIDLVVEHGPHVVQPVERINGAVVYWSVGNLVGGMGGPGRGKYSDPRTLDGLIAAVRFTETSPGHFDAAPWTTLICDEVASRVVRAPIVALADPTTPAALRPQLQQCVDRSTPVVADLH